LAPAVGPLAKSVIQGLTSGQRVGARGRAVGEGGYPGFNIWESELALAVGGWRRRLSRLEHGLERSVYRDLWHGVLLGASARELHHPSWPGPSVEIRSFYQCSGRAELMSVVVESTPEPLGIPSRILVAGSDLLTGAVAGALTAYGFSTKHVAPGQLEIELVIAWRPHLVLIDVRSLVVTSGSALVGALRQADLTVCVIDSADVLDRSNAWKAAGASALIDRSEPFDQLFRTVNDLLRMGATPRMARRPLVSLPVPQAGEEPPDPSLEAFAFLTEREQVVLAELIEGHCAEEIANAAFVSISTVRSQIKAILQKLGVNSQLAAVARARRAGWSLNGSSAFSSGMTTKSPA
jgi:two-component system nitrate/nitrite response regulator NarL